MIDPRFDVGQVVRIRDDEEKVPWAVKEQIWAPFRKVWQYIGHPVSQNRQYDEEAMEAVPEDNTLLQDDPENTFVFVTADGVWYLSEYITPEWSEGPKEVHYTVIRRLGKYGSVTWWVGEEIPRDDALRRGQFAIKLVHGE